MTETLKRTPLYDEHVKLEARIVPFAGWEMPVEYEGLRSEHMNVRENVGLFDVSHMGEIRFRGPKSLEALEWLTSNWVGKMKAGDAQYGLLTNFDGGLVDDLITYCVKPGEEYLVCVNASNTDKDFQWMVKNNKGAEITNESDQWGQIAVQGPKALALLEKVLSKKVLELGSFQWAPVAYDGKEVLVARTGYTGEDGAEVFVPRELTAKLWQDLLKHGEPFGVKPIGLGARDTLRTEMKYSLYGHEITDVTNPYEAGLGWAVKPERKDFIGRDKIVAAKEQGLKRKLVGFIMQDRGIARAEYKLFDSAGHEIGFVTSGTPSPSTGDNIGIGYVTLPFAAEDSEIYVDIRGRKVKARVCKTPFVNKK